MSRRDIIVVAALMNVALLAFLFIVSVSVDEGALSIQAPQKTIALRREPLLEEETPSKEIIHTSVEKIQEPRVESSQPPAVATATEEIWREKIPVEIPTIAYVEVTVKQGDALEKIARANATTVAAIKRANQLKTERLQIGQVLKVPLGEKKQAPVSLPIDSSFDEYYVIKRGDNPWNLAKELGVSFEELLELNQLDEDKAKNLKVGDVIRVQ